MRYYQQDFISYILPLLRHYFHWNTARKISMANYSLLLNVKCGWAFIHSTPFVSAGEWNSSRLFVLLNKTVETSAFVLMPRKQRNVLISAALLLFYLSSQRQCMLIYITINIQEFVLRLNISFVVLCQV